MKILVSTSKIKEQNMSSKVAVETGKPTKTKPAMAKIVVSTSTKKNAATITFKPTKEATLEKPKYEARLNRMGKGFPMKNAAECIAAIKPFGFDPKDAKPIRDFYAGRINAAQFKKAMGTKSYTTKEDDKALSVVKLINSAKLPTSGKGKVTRKMVDLLFVDYQKFPIMSAKDVNTFLKAAVAHNEGKFKPSMIKSIRTLFTSRNTNKRNPKISNIAKNFNTIIGFMEAQSGTTVSNGKLQSRVRKDEDGNPQAIFGIFEGRTCVRGIEVMPSFMRPFYYSVINDASSSRITPAKLKAEYKALGITVQMQDLIEKYASEEITAQQFSRAFNAGKFGTPKSTKANDDVTPSQARFPNISDYKVALFAHDLLEDGKISERQATTLNNLFGKVEDKSATLETFKKINSMFRKPEGSHSRLLGQVTYAVDQMQKKAGIKNKVTPPVLDVRLVSQRHGGTKMVIGQFRGTQSLGGVVVTPATDGGKPSYSNAASFGETFGTTKRSALSTLRKIDGFNKTHEDLIEQYANGGLSRNEFMKSFKSGKKATSTAKPKAAKAPAGKAQGTQISNADFNLELPIDSKLTAAEANKVMAYFSQLLASKEVAKAQCTRALKDLVSGEMTPQMKKRWLARVGGSDIRPVPRKLVTILRDTAPD